MLVGDLIRVKGSTVVSVFGDVRLREASRIMQARGVGALIVLIWSDREPLTVTVPSDRLCAARVMLPAIPAEVI